MKDASGVYRIRNLISGNLYVGKAKSVRYRTNEHRNALRKGIHCNTHLQAAWNKYGEEAFVFEVVELVSNEQTAEREKFWEDYYRSQGIELYNLVPCGGIGKGKGWHHTPETRAKMSATAKAQNRTWLKNIDHSSPETRKRLSESLKGNTAGFCAPGYGKILSERYKGRKLPEETRLKISLAHKRLKELAESGDLEAQEKLARISHKGKSCGKK